MQVAAVGTCVRACGLATTSDDAAIHDAINTFNEKYAAEANYVIIMIT